MVRSLSVDHAPLLDLFGLQQLLDETMCRIQSIKDRL